MNFPLSEVQQFKSSLLSKQLIQSIMFQQGPRKIYQCQKCGNHLFTEGIASGNTFGSILYSDAQRISTILDRAPEFPDLTICPSCKHMFWISKLKEIEMCEWFGNPEYKFSHVDKAEFLTIYELQDALSQVVYENQDEEIMIRLQLWRGFNDRIRNKKDLFFTDEDQIIWVENIQYLLNLLDYNNPNEKIMIAELYRNLGNFDKSLEIIESMDNYEFEWLKQEFYREIKNENTFVFRFKVRIQPKISIPPNISPKDLNEEAETPDLPF